MSVMVPTLDSLSALIEVVMNGISPSETSSLALKIKDEKYGTAYNRIQLNDKIATPEDVPSFILRAREEVSEGEIPFITTSIKADKESSV